MTKVYYLLCLIILLSVIPGCQFNSSDSDRETQARITRLEDRMSKLETAILEKETTIANLSQQVSTLTNQNNSLSKELGQLKSSTENKFAINDIDISNLMWNTWIALNLPLQDEPCLSERYGAYSQFSPGFTGSSGTMRPVLYNKLVNTKIVHETVPYLGHRWP